MNKSRILSAASLVTLLLVLAACGSEQKPADPPPADAPYQRELDKARGVEQTLQQEKDNTDRTLQEKENPTAE
jgi:predicted small lipoprotein YifL